MERHIHHYENFIGLQRSIGQTKCDFLIRIIFFHVRLIIDQFYLLISLEGVWSIPESFILIIGKFWDVHLHNM